MTDDFTPTEQMRWASIASLVAEMQAKGASFDDIVRSLAEAEDKALVYRLFDRPVPATLSDDWPAAIHFTREPTGPAN